MKKYIVDNVYIVRGKAKDCIYNLNDGKLYHINKTLTDFIYSIIQGRRYLNIDEKEVLDKLIKNDLITSKETNNDGCFMKKDIGIYKFAWIEICTSCNLMCKHCYNESSQACTDFMTYNNFIDVCKQVYELGIRRIQIIGGEPFCHKSILKFIDYASNIFDSVEVFTNGTMLDDAVCDFLKQKDIKVALSIYSYLEKEHDKVTLVKGSYNRTLLAIERLKMRNIKYRVATVHMKDVNIGEKNTDLFAINMNKDIVRVAGRGNINLLSAELFRKKMITAKTFSAPLVKERVINYFSENRCFGSKLYIASNLEVYPCVMERRLSHGNLKEENLTQLIKSDIRKLNKDYVEGCKECEFRYACHDCRPDCINNDIYSKPYYCSYDVNEGKWINEELFIENFFSK